VEREQLWGLFEKFGQLVDIVMKPRKPYAFVSFSAVEDAEAAVRAVNGQRLEGTGTDSPLLYLLYITECNTNYWLSVTAYLKKN
jgi:RNA recognition motif. (a.k.a. RRM, RBD, or RNP domain)